MNDYIVEVRWDGQSWTPIDQWGNRQPTLEQAQMRMEKWKRQHQARSGAEYRIRRV